MVLDVSTGSQTVYRESETQTIPWSPPYVIVSNDTPEVLYLACLSWGHGLPVGKHEVEIVQHLRKKRAWEKRLALMDDGIEKSKVMCDLEIAEWNFREKEIEALNQVRIKLAEKNLDAYFNLMKEKLKIRINTIAENVIRDSERKLIQIRVTRDRELRRVVRRQMGFKKQFRRENIIDEFSNPTSNMFVPPSIIGIDGSLRHEKFLVYPPLPSSFAELANLATKEIKVCYEAPYKPPHHDCMKAEDWTVEMLMKEHEKIREDYLKSPSKKHCLENGEGETDKKPRKKTWVEPVSDDLEKIYQAAVLIQRIIRGRAVQVLIFQKKLANQGLIDEIRSTYLINPKEKLRQGAEIKQIYSSLREYVAGSKTMEQLFEVVSNIESKSVVGLLEYLAKAQVRLEEEKRIHGMALIAQRERWKREAKESGTRQVEVNKKAEQEEVFKQILRTHETIADIYLEELTGNAIENTAKMHARAQVIEMARNYDKIAGLSEDLKEEEQKEELCAHLLHNYLIPEIEREAVRKKIKEQQKAHLKEAREILYGQGISTLSSNVSESLEGSSTEAGTDQDDKLNLEVGSENLKSFESETGTTSIDSDASKLGKSDKSYSVFVEQDIIDESLAGRHHSFHSLSDSQQSSGSKSKENNEENQ